MMMNYSHQRKKTILIKELQNLQLDQVERIEIPKISDIDINKPLFSTLAL